MQVSATDHCERTILLPSSILAKGQINEECLLRNMDSWDTLSLADTSGLVLERLFCCCCCVWRLPGIPLLPGITLPVPVLRKNEQSIDQLLPCRKIISSCVTCASLMSCESCQLTGHSCSNPVHVDHHFRARMSRALNNYCHAGRKYAPVSRVLVQCLGILANRCERSCSNPVHIDHQYRREGRHAGVSHGPLWENHSLPSFYPLRRSDQWRVSPSQCWKLRKLEFGRHLRPCVGKGHSYHSCWCCCVTATQESCLYQKNCCLFRFRAAEQGWAEHWTTFPILEEQTLALVQSLASLANWWAVRAAIQFISITRAHMQVSTSDHCERGIPFPLSVVAKVSDQWRVSPLKCWNPRKLDFGRLHKPCVKKILGCWCFCLAASRNPCVTRTSLACSSSEPNHVAFSGSRMSRALHNLP